MTLARKNWLMIFLGIVSGLMVLMAVLAIGCLRVTYRMESGTHHGLKRSTQTGTAWLNPLFSHTEPFLVVIAVHSETFHPTKIELDYPEVFRLELETAFTELETDSWLELEWKSYGCGNILVDTYEDNERFRHAVREAVTSGRLNPYDLLPVSQMCAIPPGSYPNDPPGKALLMQMISESLPRRAFPVPQSTPSSPSR